MFVEKGISLHRISAEHRVSQSALSSWIHIYRKGGYDALRTIKSPGRSRKDMVRPKKQVPQTELERLRYENEWLRAENALLKKVRALMEEKERQQREIGRKPSKH
jgi:transposase